MLYVAGLTREDKLVIFDTDDNVAEEVDIATAMSYSKKGLDIEGIRGDFIFIIYEKSFVWGNNYKVDIICTRPSVKFRNKAEAVMTRGDWNGDVQVKLFDYVYFGVPFFIPNNEMVKRVYNECIYQLKCYIEFMDRYMCHRGGDFIFADSAYSANSTVAYRKKKKAEEKVLMSHKMIEDEVERRVQERLSKRKG